MRLTKEQKESVIEHLREVGVLMVGEKYGAQNEVKV